MQAITLKQIRIINFISAAVTFTLWVIFFRMFFGDETVRLSPKMVPMYPRLISSPLLAVFALLISLKTKPQRGPLLYALFLSLVSANFAMQHLKNLNDTYVPVWSITVSFALTCTVFVKSLQIFPRALTHNDINHVVKWKIVAAYLKWSLKGYTWFVYAFIIFGAVFLAGFYMPVLPYTIAFFNIGILITGVLLLFTAYRRSTASERNKILWLCWGVLTYSFVSIIGITIRLFNHDVGQTLGLIISILTSVSLTLSMMMSLFFSDTFDTGILIRRTIVDGSVFTIIIILYNTIEHYFLHWLSEVLHLSDVLISSLLSGIFVMVFSPVHHRFMHFLERKIKKQAVQHAHVEESQV